MKLSIKCINSCLHYKSRICYSVFTFSVMSMGLSGASVFSIYFVTSSAANLALSCVFGAVSTMGFNALDCLGAELFPTRLR